MNDINEWDEWMIWLNEENGWDEISGRNKWKKLTTFRIFIAEKKINQYDDDKNNNMIW